ncbi:MAG: hypothetical protein IJ758_00340 [Clostridia bacterium]|nr:hypothetical protein [Clostridia bacterium]
MKKKKLKCPYCGRTVGFFEAINIKENLNFYCKDCKGSAKVKISKDINTFILILLISNTVSFLFFSFIARMFLLGSLITSLLYLCFYLLVPRTIVLKKE